MRHQKHGGKLGRTSSHRNALFRNLVTALLDHERIQTTDAKARAVRRIAERMITLGKRGDLHARRQALAVIRSRDVTAKVFDDLAPRFRARPGGYTRIVKLGHRVGDAAPVAILELVEGKEAAKAKAPAKGGKAKAKAEPKTPKTKAAGTKAKAEKAPKAPRTRAPKAEKKQAD